ncbi:ABC transporter ATP-binding protein [Microvirga antarctica]|uniref:ABC transporter ATP-binding protein n=1 Tax=Microvirga antarctica TaxID=2819233 RepID=UPI0031BA0617
MILSAASRPTAVSLQGVTCQFADYTAVEDASLTIADGEFVSIIGPTGCGKSTLLNVIAGLLEPTSGSVEIFGLPIAGLNRKAGYMFQSDSLFPWLSALDNAQIGLEFRGVPLAERKDRAGVWLNRVGLAGHEHKYPHQLSGGMRKRVSLAQMLVTDPDILLMDEPFSALDVQTRTLMENELLDLWSADRKSVAFVTHDLEEAISLSDRVVILSAGPATRPIGEFVIDIPRPRDVAEIRHQPHFIELYRNIWEAMKDEVLKAYAVNRRK